MKPSTLRPSILLACIAGLCGSMAMAMAQPAAPDTLSRIRETRSITLGVREAARPFSYLDAQKKPVGYSVDLCLAAVDEIKRELKLPDLKVLYRTVTGPERIPKLLAGEIDLECGSTTNTRARQEQVDFSYTVFVASMRVLLPKGTRVDAVKDLGGMPVALSKGTTSEKLFNQLGVSEVKLQPQTFANNDDAFQALKDGRVRAFPQDDSLLLGLAARDGVQDRFELSGMAFSVEPYAIMLRKGDAALGAVVDRTLARLYSSGEIHAVYRRWFDTPVLQIRQSRLTRDSFVRPNKEAGVAMLLGYSL